MRYFIFILLWFSLLNAASFQRDDARNIVIDKEHNLMWMDSQDSVKLYLNHEEAQKYCENSGFLGFSNWRLPDIEEFEYIVDKNNYPTNINKSFKYIINTGYWANKAHWRTLWFYADYMHFVSGTAYFDSRHKKKLVRCVRSTK